MKEYLKHTANFLKRLLKYITNLPFFASLMTLLFIYSFCNILCLAIEDGFDVLGFLQGKVIPFSPSYWSFMFAMLIFGVLALYFIYAEKPIVIGRVLSSTLFVFLIMTTVGFVGSTNSLESKTIWIKLIFVMVNVLAVFLYLLISYLFAKKEKGSKKHSRIIFYLFLGLFAVGIGISQYYMPWSIWNKLKQDQRTERMVLGWTNAILQGHFPVGSENIPSITGLDLNGTYGVIAYGHAKLKADASEVDKAVITFEFLTDFEGLKDLRKNGKLTKRIENAINHFSNPRLENVEIFDSNKKVVATYQYKKGSQKIEIPYKKK